MGKFAAAFREFAANPLTYIYGFYLLGAVSLVCGVGVVAGPGWALMASGAFMIAAAFFISKGLTPDG